LQDEQITGRPGYNPLILNLLKDERIIGRREIPPLLNWVTGGAAG